MAAPDPAAALPRGARLTAVDGKPSHTFSVTQLNTPIRDALRAAVPERVGAGRGAGAAESRAGHLYFQLVEKDARRDRVQAAIDVALFRNHLMTVHAALRKMPGVELADDVEVRIRGPLDVYPPTGRLQLIMSGIDPVFTAGKMAADRSGCCALHAEGLLAPTAPQLRPCPLRIGLVTSAGSAAYHDFVHELDVSGYASGRAVRRARPGRERAAPGGVGAAADGSPRTTSTRS